MGLTVLYFLMLWLHLLLNSKTMHKTAYRIATKKKNNYITIIFAELFISFCCFFYTPTFSEGDLPASGVANND